MNPQSPIRNPQWPTAAALAALTVLTVVVVARDVNVGGFSWSDAPLHAMDGVFIHDLVTARPEGSLRDWAEQYYLRHQCLGLIVYFPPLFAVVEAVVFLILGVSVTAARLTVLIFAIAAVWLIYLLARDLFGSAVGMAAAVLSIATPAGVAWSRQVLLEWPATFFIVLTLLAYLRYLKRPGWLTGILTAGGCLAAYLTKQTAGSVLLVILVHAWWDLRWRTLLGVRPKTLKSHRRDAGATPVLGRTVGRSFLVPIVIAILGIVGYGVATGDYSKLAPQLILGEPPLRHLLHTQAWTWYICRLPTIIGWPMFSVAATAAVTFVIKLFCERAGRLRSTVRAGEPEFSTPADAHAYTCDTGKTLQQSHILPAIWLLIWWIICSVFAAKEERYFFFAVPALAILIAAWLRQLDGRRKAGVGSAALLVLCGFQIADAVSTPAYRLPTMRDTVDFLCRQGDADLVLVDAVRDGQFIFDVCTTPAAHDHIIPMRASKFLYSRSARTRYDYQAHISTADQLRSWLDDHYGIRYVVLESRLPHTSDLSWDVPARVMLREAVSNERYFQRIYTQPLAGSDPAWQNVELHTYRYLQAKPRQTNSITVRIPAMDREVTLILPPITSRPASE